MYAVTVWALSLHPDIRANCMEQLSIDNGNCRKLMDEVVVKLHYPPCPNKKAVNKTVDEIIDIFGKNSNISLTELALTVIIQVVLIMLMLSLVDITCGMRCTPFLLLILILSHAALLPSDWELGLQSCLGVTSKQLRMGSKQI